MVDNTNPAPDDGAAKLIRLEIALGIPNPTGTAPSIANNTTPPNMEKVAQTDTKPRKPLTPKQLARREKLRKLLKALLKENQTFEESCESAGVSRRTGYRLFAKWIESEGKLVDAEFWSLFFKLRKERPAKALECLTRIKVRMLPLRFKGEADVRSELVIKGALWKPEDEKPQDNEGNAGPG